MTPPFRKDGRLGKSVSRGHYTLVLTERQAESEVLFEIGLGRDRSTIEDVCGAIGDAGRRLPNACYG